MPVTPALQQPGPSSTPLFEPPPERLVVVRALQLGDLLCAIPTFRALRAAWPSAHIALIGLPWARELVARFPAYLDEHIEFPGFPGIPEAPFDPARLATFAAEMQSRRFDLAIQLHGSGLQTNPFVALLGAERTLGFYPPGGWIPDPATHFEYPGHGREVVRMLALLEAAGLPVADRSLEFPVTQADRAEIAALPEMNDLDGRPYVVVHPGARHELRRWPVERFQAVARVLAEADWPVVLTGTQGEAALTGAISRAVGPAAIDLAGRTSLGGLAAVISGATLVVANDTGAAHLADALGTPSVIVFVHTDPDRWAAADRSLHRVVATRTQPNGCTHADGDAHRCLADACTLADRSGRPPVVGDVPVEAVLAEAYDLLSQEVPRVA